MHRSVEVLIVGGGPAGLFAAQQLARAGIDTLVCEEHQTVGDPVHCTGILAVETFDDFELPREATINMLGGARFVSPGGIAVDYTPAHPVAAVIDRSVFDRALARRAESAGAVIRTGARVSLLDPDASRVHAVVEGDLVQARLVLLGCGANYAFQRRLGLGVPRAYLHTAQRELSADRLCDLELHFGRGVAPDGFSWAVPVNRPEGPCVRVGVMTARDAPGCYARMVDRVRDSWGILPGQAPPRQKILPLGTIDRTVATRVIAIGDAAGLVKPTTGGGIYYSILSASLAAEVAIDALRSDRLDAGALSTYERTWRQRLDDEFDAQHALRRVAAKLPDTDIDDLFELARTDGIMPIVRATARFNRHRDLIRALFRHPPARRVLFRSVIG